jgi:hypothetical protein
MPHVDGNPTPDCGLRGVDLLDEVIRQIEAHPENWYQGDWARAKVETDENGELPKMTKAELDAAVPTSCGTAMCVAGWAAHLTGAKIDWQPTYDDTVSGVVDSEVLYILSGFVANSVNDNTEKIDAYARRVLELDHLDSSELFVPHNDMERIYRLRARMAQGLPFEDDED